MNKITKKCLKIVLLFSFIIGFLGIRSVQAKEKDTIVLNYKNLMMQKGSYVYLNAASAKGLKSNQKVTWKSSNKKVASVSKKGLVKAKKTGNVTITAKSRKGKASCKIKVQEKKEAQSGVLVAYFSCTGNTKGIAEKIASASKGDIYRIIPAEEYSAEDLEYGQADRRAVREQGIRKYRPQLMGEAVNIKDYETIFIGYPIWSEEAPRVISTFMESYRFSGKTIIPFCTSAGSGISSSVEALKSQAPKNITWQNGRQFSGTESQETVGEWVDSLGIVKNDNLPYTPDEQQPADETEPSENLQAEKTLVAFFSCTNTTKKIAEYIAQAERADLYQIVPEIPYTSEDLAYGNSSSRANTEQNDPSVRPAISGSVENMQDYKVIYLGYPVWQGQAPRIISTFLEKYDFTGKRIIPFCTSHSSGIGSSDTDLHGLCASSAIWEKGRRFAAGASEEEVTSWLAGVGRGNAERTYGVSDFALSEGKNGQAPVIKLNSGYVEGGEYEIMVAASAADIKLKDTITVEGTQAPLPYESSKLADYYNGSILNISDAEYKELLGHDIPDGSWSGVLDINDAICQMYYAKSRIARLVYKILTRMLEKAEAKGKPDLNLLFIYNMPFRGIAKMTGGMVTMEMAEGILMAVNGRLIKGLGKIIGGFFRSRSVRKKAGKMN